MARLDCLSSPNSTNAKPLLPGTIRTSWSTVSTQQLNTYPESQLSRKYCCELFSSDGVRKILYKENFVWRDSSHRNRGAMYRIVSAAGSRRSRCSTLHINLFSLLFLFFFFLDFNCNGQARNNAQTFFVFFNPGSFGLGNNLRFRFGILKDLNVTKGLATPTIALPNTILPCSAAIALWAATKSANTTKAWPFSFWVFIATRSRIGP